MKSYTLLCAVLGLVGSYGITSAQTIEKPNLTKQPTLYVVGYAHLDTEWRWEYPQVINEYLRKTMKDNFALFTKYPHYIFNFSGANRYRFMKEYYPADFAKVKSYVAAGRWFPAGSSMEEGDVNTPSAESIIRQILYGNEWFRREFGKASAEYMLPDCFGFPASLPTILAHAGVKGFSTQKLTWGSSADAGGPDSREKTPEGTPFNVGVWVGPDGETVLAALNPGSYSGDINTDLSKSLPPAKPNPELEQVRAEMSSMMKQVRGAGRNAPPSEKELHDFIALRQREQALEKEQQLLDNSRYQGDWAARVENNGKASGLFTDYHYYGTGDVGGSPRESSVKRLEAIVTQGEASFPPEGYIRFGRSRNEPEGPLVKVGDGPVHVVSATAEQMFSNIPDSAVAGLPRYTGEMELTNHSAGSLTSQAYHKRWLRKEELLADAAERSSVAAEWLGARTYPLKRLNNAWTLVMGGQFHDLAAGTATPKAYEFAWNDDVLAMNQFASVFENSVQDVAAALDTKAKGVPLVVFNPLNIGREDIVEADVKFPDGTPRSVRVVDPQGREVPAQISDGKIIFSAKVPSVGYAVYDVRSASEATEGGELRVTDHSLENAFYVVKLDSNGDIASIFDKKLQKELLAKPARLAISYDNPKQWPAWNMDWDQEQAAPKAYVSGPAQLRVLEKGPARVAVEVSRKTAGSTFVQTISLAAGDAGQRVEVRNVVDWNTRESNLKAVFPLTASNSMATYNWDIGTIERPTAQPKKFEVPSHQWVDLTDLSQEFGATILTDCKNGSDKPTDNTIRLTLIRTPGVSGGYPDQATQDIGHHEFVYGIAGHVGGWRQAQTDWQGERLNAPLVAFETKKHSGSLGREFSLLKVDNPRVRVMAVKRAEADDEVVVRLVELDGAPQPNVHVSFASPIVSAREVNGQEQEVGPASVRNGVLVTSFHAYQPRSFALKLGAPKSSVAKVQSAPVSLRFDTATASEAGRSASTGFDGKGNTFAAEMLPSAITFDGVDLHLGPARTGVPDAVTANGQTISLPAGRYNRLYVLAAAAGGDQKAEFLVGGAKVDETVEDWGGFIGQWDDRQWIAKDREMPARGNRPARMQHDDYAEMTGIKPGYIKRADVAWYADHHHDAAGNNVPYGYSYLFAYAIDVPEGAKTVTLPKNDQVRVFAMTVVEENPSVAPAQPLYDTLGRSEPGAVKSVAIASAR